MKTALHLIGTGHHLQFGAGARFGGYACSAEDEKAFATFLAEAAQRSSAIAIAEELNRQALIEVGCQTSVAERVSSALGIAHLFCEPDRSERAALGIMDENDVRASLVFKKFNEEQVQAKISDHVRLREEEWLRRVAELGTGPILFVCGANHVDTFTALLDLHGLQVTIVCRDWEP